MHSDRIAQTEGSGTAARPIPSIPTHPVEPEYVEDHGEAHEEHVHLPPRSIWPITTALGLTIAGMGLVTYTPVSFAGIAVGAWGIISWIQELRHELH